MNVLGESDLQIWNNQAFDDGDISDTFKPLPVNLSSDSSFSSKENKSPIGFITSKSSVLHNPLHQSKPFKNLPIKIGSLKPSENLDKTDEEIEIENEIKRLVARLEAIRAEKNAMKSVQKQGKSVLVVDTAGVKKVQETRNNVQRRGFSLGPNEIMSATNSKAKQFGTTPSSVQSRRKSCFWKLDDIEEETSRSKNPNTRIRQAVTTIGSKKMMKKDDSVLASIQPKKLFGETVKKPVKPGRVVPSRYNQATVNSSMKKRENVERKSNSEMVKKKKTWEIPRVIVIPNRLNLDENENEDEDMNEDDSMDVVMQEVVLPRIRVGRCVEEAGRDSGPAKRVVELVGKKSYFDEEAVCQKLSFDQD
ncbi:hypothetical protein QVD17_11299 [Tagetes erecta]|uniref:Uncharacterized protein n=1 Tax=Tagetes erecta TaxID=13708 RepID=A0AAD8KU08_TARER|nr:hypothetical protein QVD17_11299 [Tagetes erecta]